MLRIARAETKADYVQAESLILELKRWDEGRTRDLGLDAREMLSSIYGDEVLPGSYAPPDGCLLLATVESKPAGCCAFRKLSPDVCELRHLYVRPEYRGMRIGRGLGEALLGRARDAGYHVIRLETASFMQEAHALYYALGFERRDAYHEIPDPFRAITLFMERRLEEGV